MNDAQFDPWPTRLAEWLVVLGAYSFLPFGFDFFSVKPYHKKLIHKRNVIVGFIFQCKH